MLAEEPLIKKVTTEHLFILNLEPSSSAYL